MNKELTIREYNAQSEEWAELFFMIYEMHAEYGVPQLDSLYDEFKRSWFSNTVEYLHTNKDAWELSDDDLLGVEVRLQEIGFVCPTYEQIQQIMDVDQISYREHDGSYLRMAVTGVW